MIISLFLSMIFMLSLQNIDMSNFLNELDLCI